MNRIAKLERRRFLSLFWFLVGFLVYQGGRVVKSFSSSFDTFSFVITVLSLLGGAVWTYHLVRMLLLKREMSDRECRQMNDERVQTNGRRSFTVGFFALMVATVPLLFVQTAFRVTTAAELLLFIGVGSSTGAFLYFESEGLSTILGGPRGVAHE